MVVVAVLALVGAGGAARARHMSTGRMRGLGDRPRRVRRQWRSAVVLAASVMLGIVSVPLAVLPWLVGAIGKVVAKRRTVRGLRQQVVLGLPDTIDLARIVITSGATVTETVEVLAARAPEPFAGAFTAAATEVRQGVRLVDALPTVTNQVGESARGIVRALQTGERDGVSVAPLLERVRVEALRVRRHELEVAARRLPVLLLFPLVVCVLPAFVLLTVVPLLANALQDLQV